MAALPKPPPVVQTNLGPMSEGDLLDHLTYSSYRAQRDLHGASVEVCARLFPAKAAEYEARFQREVNAQANRRGEPRNDDPGYSTDARRLPW